MKRESGRAIARDPPGPRDRRLSAHPAAAGQVARRRRVLHVRRFPALGLDQWWRDPRTIRGPRHLLRGDGSRRDGEQSRPDVRPRRSRAAHVRGHEIACHTLRHRDCGRTSPAEIARRDRPERRGAVQAPDGAVQPDQFRLSLRRRLAVGEGARCRARFASCRGTGRGLNQGTVDLADLSVPAFTIRTSTATHSAA